MFSVILTLSASYKLRVMEACGATSKHFAACVNSCAFTCLPMSKHSTLSDAPRKMSSIQIISYFGGRPNNKTTSEKCISDCRTPTDFLLLNIKDILASPPFQRALSLSVDAALVDTVQNMHCVLCASPVPSVLWSV